MTDHLTPPVTSPLKQSPLHRAETDWQMLTVSPWSALLLQWTKVLSRHSTVLLLVVVAAPSQTSSLPRQVEMEEAGRSGRKGAVDWSQREGGGAALGTGGHVRLSQLK